MTTSRSTGSPSSAPASRATASRVLARLAGLAALLVAAWILVRPGVAEARRRQPQLQVHVVDGAALSANLGVNPSLSITALAERAGDAVAADDLSRTEHG